jgi:hypothetical protein
VVGFDGDIEFTGPTTFFLAQSGNLSLLGSVGVSGDPTPEIPYYFDPAGALEITAMTGVVTVSGNLRYIVPKNIQRLAPVAVTGVLGVAGDIGYTVTPGVVHPLVQDGPIALTGTMATSGDVAFGTAFEFEPTGSVAIAGALGITGNISIPGPHVIAQSGAIGLTGTLDLADTALGFSFAVTQSGAVAMAGVLAFRKSEFSILTPQAAGPGGLTNTKRRRK